MQSISTGLPVDSSGFIGPAAMTAVLMVAVDSIAGGNNQFTPRFHIGSVREAGAVRLVVLFILCKIFVGGNFKFIGSSCGKEVTFP